MSKMIRISKEVMEKILAQTELDKDGKPYLTTTLWVHDDGKVTGIKGKDAKTGKAIFCEVGHIARAKQVAPVAAPVQNNMAAQFQAFLAYQQAQGQSAPF